jgi:hypothetical protein
MFTFLSLVSLLLATPALAAPLQSASCDISTITLHLPADQSLLVAPTSAPSFIVLGVGVQNYTCSPSSTYTSVHLHHSLIFQSLFNRTYRSTGAVAELFDISCLTETPDFATIQDTAYASLPADPPYATSAEVISLMQELKLSTILGQHYFVPTPTTHIGISPNWDFTSSGPTAGNLNAFVIAAKVASIPAPTGSNDVDWVSLTSVQGELATQVFRTDTKGGQPPALVSPS